MIANTHITVKLMPKLRLEEALKKAGVEDPVTVTHLTIFGRITDSDFEYIRLSMNALCELDMGNASVERNRIKSNVFCCTTSLTSVIIPDSVKTIDSFAFWRCSLSSIFIPCSIKRIERMAFSICCNLTSITVHPDNLSYLSENGILFSKDKTKLIKYPEGRQGDYAIPESVTAIQCGALNNCTGLTSIIIPDSTVELIDGWWFTRCSKLTSITVHPNNPAYTSENGVLFNKNKNVLVSYPRGRQGDYVIPNTVTKIESFAFANSTGLPTVTIPNSVTEIGFLAFADCTGLKFITIPDSVKKIDNAFKSFDGCQTFITVHPDNPVYTSENGELKAKAKKQPKRRKK